MVQAEGADHPERVLVLHAGRGQYGEDAPYPRAADAVLKTLSKLGSLLAYGLGHIKSPLEPYQVIFLFCGAITVAFSIVML